VERNCARHGRTAFALTEGGTRWRCLRCRAESVSKFRRSIKDRLIDLFGGACLACGYRRSRRALGFHHVDPSLKELGVSRMQTWEASLAEARKCVLLCANCHAEVEDGVRPCPDLVELAA